MTNLIHTYRYIESKKLGLLLFPATHSHEDFWRERHIHFVGGEILSLGFIEETFDDELHHISLDCVGGNDPISTMRVQNKLNERLKDESTSIVQLVVNDDRKTLDFKTQCNAWINACFSKETIYNTEERCHRFLEEALELVQSLGYSQNTAYRMVDYVFNRPPGEVNQEIGGVMVSLYALGVGTDRAIDDAARKELARCIANIDKIRNKQSNKPAAISVDARGPSVD